MNTDFLGDLNDVDNPVRAAGRSACFVLDLPISDAAFDLIDKLAEYMRDEIDVLEDPDDLVQCVEDSASLAGDWMSGSGVISCYTSAQVQQWAELGAWQADLSEYAPLQPESAVDYIGKELAGIASAIAWAMSEVILELADEESAS